MPSHDVLCTGSSSIFGQGKGLVALPNVAEGWMARRRCTREDRETLLPA